MVENHSGGLDERLLGFDARKMWLDPKIHWDRERRAHFLLRMDAGRVLSTDDLVWPSVFHTHQLPLTPKSELEELGLDGPQRPRWVGPNLPLWEDLDSLKAHLLAKDAGIKRPYWIIAVTAHLYSEIESQLTYGPYFEKTDPGRLKPWWTFLGYDVSDGSLLSGLTNCGYTQDEKRNPPATAEDLNRHHLFDSLKQADKFRTYSDNRVKEHAPFLVYGLYLVEEIAL
jgi:hypothetical protein